MTNWSRRDLLGAGVALGALGLPGSSRAAVPGARPLPPVVDLSALFGPVKDQGLRSTCTYFAATALIEAALARKTGMLQPLSEQYLTDLAHAGKRPPADETTDVGRVLSLAMDHGMVPASALPYRTRLDTDHPVPPPAPALLALGKRMQLSFGGNSFMTVRGLQGWLLKGPVTVALAYPPDQAGWRDDGLVQPVPALLRDSRAMKDMPNHYVLLTGYDQYEQMFFLRSSWGPGWGRSGYGRISFESMQTRWFAGGAFRVRRLTLA